MALSKLQWLSKRLNEAVQVKTYVPSTVSAEAAEKLRVGSDIIKLDANENFLFPREFLSLLLCQLSRNLDPRLYPSFEEDRLVKILANHLNISEDKIVLGNSSDELLEIIVETFLRRGEAAVSIYPTFVMYRVIVESHGCNFVDVPLGRDYALRVDDILDAANDSTFICFICSPNNPTGNQFPANLVEDLVKRFPGLVVIDEAYADFAQYSLVNFVEDFDNLIIVRTFSKAFGLAGLRIGYAVASGSIANALRRMQLPYHINTVSLSMAAEVLKHYELVAEVIEKIKEERRWLMEALKSIGVKPFPSDANFILTKTPKSSTFVSNALMKRNVLVRSFGDIPLLEGCIRITVGSRMMNDRVVSALKEII